MNKVLKTLLDM